MTNSYFHTRLVPYFHSWAQLGYLKRSNWTMWDETIPQLFARPCYPTLLLSRSSSALSIAASIRQQHHDTLSGFQCSLTSVSNSEPQVFGLTSTVFCSGGSKRTELWMPSTFLAWPSMRQRCRKPKSLWPLCLLFNLACPCLSELTLRS